MSKRIESDIGIAVEVALFVRFVHEHGLWEQWQAFKEKEKPWAENEINDLFQKKGWTS